MTMATAKAKALIAANPAAATVGQTRSRRVGGATYQVPVSVPEERGHSLALRWVRNYSRERKGKPMHEKLAQELIDGFNKTGASSSAHRSAPAAPRL